MANPATAPETRHTIRRIRRSPRKSVLDLSLVTVEMEPAGFGLMLDVSEDGLGVQVMNKIKPGTEVQIKFDVPDSSVRVEAAGVVTWYDGEGRVGVRFQQIKDNNSEVLRKWIETLPEAPTDFASRSQKNDAEHHPALLEQVRAIQQQIAASHLNVDLVLQFLVERVAELTYSTGGAIALGTDQEMICRASTGLAPDVGVKISSDSALTAECLRTGRTIRCDDTETDSRVDREICRRLDLRSLLILPILFEGKVRGVLEVFAPKPNAFTEQHMSMLQQLAEFTSQIVYEPVDVTPAKPAANAKATVAAERPSETPSLPKTPVVETIPAAPINPAAVPAGKPGPPKQDNTEAAQKPSGRMKRRAHSVGSGAAVAPALAEKPSAEAKESKAEALAEMFPEIEPVQDPGYRKLVLPLASLVILLIVLGYWFKMRGSNPQPAGVGPSVQPAVTKVAPPPATIAPPATTVAVTDEPAVEESKVTPEKAAAPKPRTQDLVEDSVRQAPITVASSSSSLRMKDDAPVSAPSLAGTATPANLAGLKLPGVTNTPEYRARTSVTGGVPIHQVKPTYPMAAREQHVEGDVVLAVRVMKNGMVGNIRKVSGNILLASAAEAAVKRWRYEPFKVNGEAQTLDTTITVQFRLPK